MENARIRENRRTNFLAKMENKKKYNQNENNINPSLYFNNQSNMNNNPVSYLQTDSMINHNYNNVLQNPSNNYNNNYQQNNFFNNNNYQQNNFIYNNRNNNQFQNINKNKPKIDFNELLEKINQLDYMINFQKFFKILILIILTILHCLKYSPLNNCFVFKYTFIVLELSSLYFHKYYNEQKKIITENTLYKNNNNTNQPKSIFEISFEFINNFKYFNYVFIIINFLKDFIFDVSLMLFINIIFFLMNNED